MELDLQRLFRLHVHGCTHFADTPQTPPPPPLPHIWAHRALLEKDTQRLNMELGLQSWFGLHVHSCTHWLRPRKPHPPPHPLRTPLGKNLSETVGLPPFFGIIQEGREASKSPHDTFGYFLSISQQVKFLPISLKIQLLETFPQKQKVQDKSS